MPTAASADESTLARKEPRWLPPCFHDGHAIILLAHARPSIHCRRKIIIAASGRYGLQAAQAATLVGLYAEHQCLRAMMPAALRRPPR